MHKTIILLVALLPLLAMGQSHGNSGKKPFWAAGYFKDLDNSYLEVVSAFDYDLSGAREKAAKEIVRKRSISVGTEANVRIEGNDVVVASERDLIVKARIIDEYAEHTPGGYTVYQLVQTAKNPAFQYEAVSVSREYRVGARGLVPGMAQIYKGSKWKGGCLIAGEVAAIASIVFCECERNNNLNKIKERPKFAKEYSNRANNCLTGRNVCIGVAAGLWAYSIIDAYVAKGAPRITVKRAKHSSLSLRPMACPGGSGISMAYHF